MPAKFAAWTLLASSLPLGPLTLAMTPPEQLRSQAELTVPMMLTIPLGVLILFRSPNRRIGWLLTTLGAWGVWPAFVNRYAGYGAPLFPTLASAFDGLAGWLDSWTWFPWLAIALMILPQLFPTGHPLPGRWRGFFRATIGIVTVLTLTLAVAGLPFVEPLGDGLEELLEPFVGLLFLGTILISAVSLAVRYRSSSWDERQQIKWISFAISFLAGTFLLGAALSLILEGDCCATEFATPLFDILGGLTLLGIPISIAVSILKYRLYDIDLLIRRTLLYGMLTATLGGAYFATVLVLQMVLPTQTQLSIVLSTLLIAALFSPARRRLQAVIDRRFHRQPYDPERVMQAFSAALRDQLEAERISESVLNVIGATIQPAHASIWIRER